jgi:polar amino acid transport system substrate-binding protein
LTTEITLRERLSLLLLTLVILVASIYRGDAQVASRNSRTTAGDSKTLRVATRVVAPFVMQDGARLQGFSIDLWNAIAQQLGTRTEYSINPSVNSLLSSVQARRADAGIAAISITAERERRFDFSQPMYDSGLQIMVRSQARRRFGHDLLERAVLAFYAATGGHRAADDHCARAYRVVRGAQSPGRHHRKQEVFPRYF